MNQEEFSELIDKYQSGELDARQKALLDQWFETIGSSGGQAWTDAELEALHKKISAEIGRRERRETGTVQLLRWLPYVAATLLVCLGGLYYYQTTVGTTQKQYIDAEQSAANARNILPGSNKATLTFADGRVVELGSNHTGIVVGDRFAYDDGTVLFESTATDVATGIYSDAFTLATPKGGQYQLTLPDGSRIWLNAASTLKYPGRSIEQGRKIELTGEAYFEIAKYMNASGPASFLVHTAAQEVEVLGTQFNISAYADETETKTTLVEGAVLVRQSADGAAQKGSVLRLVPGEAAVSRQSGMHAYPANLESEVAWRSGIFSFDSVPFDQMMRQISRWYNIDVAYESKVPKEHFKGKMSRNVNLQVLIRFLQDSGINLRFDGRTLLIRQ